MKYKAPNCENAYSNSKKINCLNEDDISQSSNEVKMSTETCITTKSSIGNAITKNDNIVIRNYNTVSQGSNLSTNLSSNTMADKENCKRNSTKEIGKIFINKQTRYRRKMESVPKDNGSTDILSQNKFIKASNKNVKSNKTEQSLFIKHIDESDQKSIIKFNENRRRLDSIKEVARHMKSNDSKIYNKKVIQFNKSHRSNKTPSFPIQKDEEDEKFQYYKTNSSLSTTTGGKIYYSSWKEAFHLKRSLNSRRVKQDPPNMIK